MKNPLVLKTILVAVLAVALFVPVSMIRDLVSERQARRNEAVAGIAEGWGKQQVVGGPYLAIPYERQWTEVKKETVDGKERELRTERRSAEVLRVPARSVEWAVEADIGEKSRGIYKARLYGAKLRIQGEVELPARGSAEDSTSRYRWYVPRLVLTLSDPIGIRAAPDAVVNGRTWPFTPGPGDAAASAGLHVPMPDFEPGAQAKPLKFVLSLELAGSEAFSIAPLGADTTVRMKADWPHPSFQGRFLPVKHELNASGFFAQWKVSRFSMQESRQTSSPCAFPCSRMGEQLTVLFIEPASLYQRLERASKYGFLFIGITFAAFTLFELLRRLAIHPIQYALVGLALAMFFLLLVALSEHIAFIVAYAIASVACVALLTFYFGFVLKNKTLGMAFGAALGSLYALLYALIRSEDYALLGGSLLLFALLAAVIVGTRRVDWYSLTKGEQRA